MKQRIILETTPCDFHSIYHFRATPQAIWMLQELLKAVDVELEVKILKGLDAEDKDDWEDWEKIFHLIYELQGKKGPTEGESMLPAMKSFIEDYIRLKTQ